jgi:hypothetical protein
MSLSAIEFFFSEYVRWMPRDIDREIGGWSSMALRKYRGKIPVVQLKRHPTTLERVFGRAI